jgi:hypothetical protein
MDFLQGMTKAMQQAAADNCADTYANVATDLVKSKDAIRQAIERATAEAIAAIIPKLENNQPLNSAEKETVKLWVVGDAEGYVKMENNFQDWLKEYRRLMDVIADWENKVASVEELVEIHGALEDAIKVADAMAHFLDDRERVARFENAINNLQAEDNRFIANLLKSMLASPEL